MAPPLLVGLSGPSSSGKTTLARLLRDVLPARTVILHQDDFYLPEDQLPLRAGLRDWDCAAALDLPAMEACLRHAAATGALPADLQSKEDRNDVGPSGISPAEITQLRANLRDWARNAGHGGVHRSEVDEAPADATASVDAMAATDASMDAAASSNVVIIDGFLLYGQSVPQLPPLFSLRLMLRADYAAVKQRREARSGYVTLEGFWEDPPGYVDKVVWPGYVEEHAYLFHGGDVEGDMNEAVVEGLGLEVCPGKGSGSMKDLLAWALDEIKTTLQKQWSAEKSHR